MDRCWCLACSFTLLAAAAGGGAIASPQSAATAPLLERSGTIVVKVTDYEPARERLRAVARRLGAEEFGSRTQVDFQGKRQGRMQFRLPAAQWALLLPSAREAGKVYAESLRTADRTSEYEELAQRIDRLREHEQRLQGLLQSPRRMRGSDLLYLQERLFRAGVDEEQLAQRRADLARSAQTGTLAVELFEPEPRRAMDLGNWYAGSMLRARTALYRTVARGLTAGAYVLAFAPFWIPGLALVLLLGRWLWRQGRALVIRLGALVSLLAREVWRWWQTRPRRAAPVDLAGG